MFIQGAHFTKSDTDSVMPCKTIEKQMILDK